MLLQRRSAPRNALHCVCTLALTRASQTVRFKNELERNITIKLGYANAKIYKCEDESCPRPSCYRYVASAARGRASLTP